MTITLECRKPTRTGFGEWCVLKAFTNQNREAEAGIISFDELRKMADDACNEWRNHAADFRGSFAGWQFRVVETHRPAHGLSADAVTDFRDEIHHPALTQAQFNAAVNFMTRQERNGMAAYWQESQRAWYAMAQAYHPNNNEFHFLADLETTIRDMNLAAQAHRLARLYAGTWE